ncbi:MAG: excinuclease ATPase subunit [Gammaproteobacteria bacterium]|nr:excinuclease ATPase subunit [Gammaproteobacteria bacterium]
MNSSKLVAALIGGAAALVVNTALARDEMVRFPIAEAISAPEAIAKLNPSIKFFFGDSQPPAVERSFGVFTSNKKTNAFGKSDKIACDWAFLSAMLSFQDRALQTGGDAVINVKSYYKRNTVSSTTEYECGAGSIMAGVTFQGEVVKLKK